MLEFKKGHESHFIFNVELCIQVVTDHVPEATDKVSYKESYDDKPEDSVDVHEHVDRDYPLFPLQAVKDRFDHFAESHDINQFEDTRQSE